MTTIQERLEEFKKLSFADQKAKMIVILIDLKNSDEVFAKLLDIVQTSPKADAEFLAGTYQNIMEFAEAIQANNTLKAGKVLNVFQEKIKKIHEMEAADRAKEHPEDLLNQIP